MSGRGCKSSTALVVYVLRARTVCPSAYLFLSAEVSGARDCSNGVEESLPRENRPGAKTPQSLRYLQQLV